VFFKPIISELKKLERGIEIEINKDTTKIIKFFAIAGVFDKPARASVLNMTQFNGFGGCIKCLQLGESLETLNGKQILNQKFKENII
jgi:hypothetical protein